MLLVWEGRVDVHHLEVNVDAARKAARSVRMAQCFEWFGGSWVYIESLQVAKGFNPVLLAFGYVEQKR